MMKIKRFSIYALVSSVALASLSQAATYTWISSGGAGQDGDWNNTANWDVSGVPVDSQSGTGNDAGLTFGPSSGDSIIFAGTSGPSSNFPGLGGNVGADTPTMLFNSGGTFDFAFVGRETSLWTNIASTPTVFTVGDGIGGGTEDVTLNLSGLSFISRHAKDVTNNFLVNSDGALNFNAGVDFQYPNTFDRLASFTIAGGDVTFAGGLIDFTVNSGTYVDFTAVGGSFSAEYGESGGYADASAVSAALVAGVNWKNNSGGTLQVTDNGSGFTVTAVPEPSSTALLGLGGLALILRRRR